uniref:C3H1-type domain-containing protein n=1 Tax=Heterosigma akashiwo TaxID=2829 RepID=A0A7S3XUN8_HETAK
MYDTMLSEGLDADKAYSIVSKLMATDDQQTSAPPALAPALALPHPPPPPPPPPQVDNNSSSQGTGGPVPPPPSPPPPQVDNNSSSQGTGGPVPPPPPPGGPISTPSAMNNPLVSGSTTLQAEPHLQHPPPPPPCPEYYGTQESGLLDNETQRLQLEELKRQEQKLQRQLEEEERRLKSMMEGRPFPGPPGPLSPPPAQNESGISSSFANPTVIQDCQISSAELQRQQEELERQQREIEEQIELLTQRQVLEQTESLGNQHQQTQQQQAQSQNQLHHHGQSVQQPQLQSYPQILHHPPLGQPAAVVTNASPINSSYGSRIAAQMTQGNVSTEGGIQQQQQQQQQPQQHSMMTQQHLGAQSPSLAPQPCPAVPQQVRFSNCSSPPPSMGGQPSYAGGGPPEQPVLQTVSHQLAAPANTTSQNFQSPIQHRTQPQLMYQQTSDHKQSQPQHLLSAAIGQHTNRSLGQLHHTVGTGGQHLPLMTNGRGPPPPPPPPQPSLLPQASCVFFQNKGWCKNGTGCQFAHNKVEPLTTQPPQQVWLQPQVVMMTNNSSNHHQQHQHFGS